MISELNTFMLPNGETFEVFGTFSDAQKEACAHFGAKLDVYDFDKSFGWIYAYHPEIITLYIINSIETDDQYRSLKCKL